MTLRIVVLPDQTDVCGMPLFRSVRGRLLALMTLIVIPIAILSVVLASTTYRSVVRSLQEAQVQTTSNFAARTRIWFRGMLRGAMAGVAAVEAVGGSEAQCRTVAAHLVAGMQGYQALRLKFSSGVDCFYSALPALTREKLDEIAQRQGARAPLQPLTGVSLADTHYGATRIDGQLSLVVFARDSDKADHRWEATLLIDPVLLDQAFDIGTIAVKSAVALIGEDGEVVVSRGAEENDLSWLPADPAIITQPGRQEGLSRGGRPYAYASQLVAEPDFYILARFDEGASTAARYQFLVLFITPLLTLALLFIAYARAIQNNVVRWIAGIEKAARHSAGVGERRLKAPADPAMPEDIRNVAEAFNSMVEDADHREIALRQSLEANHFLMRELHHRVKNSLQVIQSYLALSRRQDSGTRGSHLAETEAKILVLSAAYRFALTDGGMRPVAIRPIVTEVLDNVAASLRQPSQRIEVRIDADMGLVVDRIIPLGLALVEAAVAGLKADGATRVTVRLTTLADGRLDLQITTDGRLLPKVPAPKILAGLAAQLGAMPGEKEPGEVLHWRFGS